MRQRAKEPADKDKISTAAEKQPVSADEKPSEKPEKPEEKPSSKCNYPFIEIKYSKYSRYLYSWSLDSSKMKSAELICKGPGESLPDGSHNRGFTDAGLSVFGGTWKLRQLRLNGLDDQILQ